LRDASVTARFLKGCRGDVFTLLHRPRATTSGRSVLVVPPFAEEMNKSRRMLTRVAHRLAARGIATLVPDLFGTGDSAGEFAEADWDVWKDDLIRSAAWAAYEGWPLFALLCTRLGCILGAEIAQTALTGVERTVCWQPVIDGPRFLDQFLRLRVAASMMAGARRESVAELKNALRRGESLEVAGYELPAQLAQQIESRTLLQVLGPQVGELHWVELVSTAEAPLSVASAHLIAQLPARGLSSKVHRVVGEAFWTSIEIVENPALIESAVALLSAPP
jgi:exosortase A-associated hydrolase 2